MSGCIEDLTSGNRWVESPHCKHVLKLIPETESTAGLIKAASAPDAAGERLIKPPAVEHQVGSFIGSVHLDSCEQVFPIGMCLLEGCLDHSWVLIFLCQGVELFFIQGIPNHKVNLTFAIGLQVKVHLHNRAIVNSDLDVVCKADAVQGGRIFKGTPTSQKFHSVGGKAMRYLVGHQEGNLVAQLGMVRVANAQHQMLRIVLGNEHCVGVLVGQSQNPFEIVGRRDATIFRQSVLNF